MRLLTALAILVLSGLTGAWGWQAAQFGRARLAALALVGSEGDRPDLVRWIGTPGLTSEAFTRMLETPSAAVTPAPLRAAEAKALLEVSPMSPRAWLTLAEAQSERSDASASFDKALEMSWVTGPNEPSIMWERGVFGVARWEALPGDARSRAVIDLATAFAGGLVDGDGVRFAKSVFTEKSPTVRATLADQLSAAGIAAPLLAAVGLGSSRDNGRS